MTHTMELTYRDLIDTVDAMFHAGAHATHDEEVELRAAVDRLLDVHHSTASASDIDAIRQNAQLL